jgi:hypothetical protein
MPIETGSVSGRWGSNPQPQPWEGNSPFLYSGALDKPLRMSIHPPFSSATTWPSPVTIGQSIGVDVSHLNLERSAPARFQPAVLTHPLTERRVK